MNKKILLFSAALSPLLLFGAGYKIPEQSSDSVALGSSNIAKSYGADASFYNPANMSFLDRDSYFIEGGLTYIYLGKTKFKNYSKVAGTKDQTSKKERFVTPTFHFVTKEYNKFRYGVSLAVPAGIAMKWDGDYAKATSHLFMLKIIELSSSAAYRVSDNFSIAAGARAVYSEGETENYIENLNYKGININATRHMNGDSIDFGYLVATTYKPLESLSFSATYKSKVNLTLKGNSRITSTSTPPVPPGLGLNGNYEGGASITVPLPATLTLASAYEYDKFDFMFAFERTFWSKLKELDFDYDGKVPFAKAFEEPQQKNWKDANAYRIGFGYRVNDNLRLMAGFSYDEAATKSQYVGFELPDTKAYVYSTGFSYKIDKSKEIAGSFLYQDRQNRRVDKQGKTFLDTVDGKFQSGKGMLTNLTFKYKF